MVTQYQGGPGLAGPDISDVTLARHAGHVYKHTIGQLWLVTLPHLNAHILHLANLFHCWIDLMVDVAAAGHMCWSVANNHLLRQVRQKLNCLHFPHKCSLLMRSINLVTARKSLKSGVDSIFAEGNIQCKGLKVGL